MTASHFYDDRGVPLCKSDVIIEKGTIPDWAAFEEVSCEHCRVRAVHGIELDDLECLAACGIFRRTN